MDTENSMARGKGGWRWAKGGGIGTSVIESTIKIKFKKEEKIFKKDNTHVHGQKCGDYRRRRREREHGGGHRGDKYLINI